jgi:hypothetical protein
VPAVSETDTVVAVEPFSMSTMAAPGRDLTRAPTTRTQ